MKKHYLSTLALTVMAYGCQERSTSVVHTSEIDVLRSRMNSWELQQSKLQEKLIGCGWASESGSEQESPSSSSQNFRLVGDEEEEVPVHLLRWFRPPTGLASDLADFAGGHTAVVVGKLGCSDCSAEFKAGSKYSAEQMKNLAVWRYYGWPTDRKSDPEIYSRVEVELLGHTLKSHIEQTEHTLPVYLRDTEHGGETWVQLKEQHGRAVASITTVNKELEGMAMPKLRIVDHKVVNVEEVAARVRATGQVSDYVIRSVRRQAAELNEVADTMTEFKRVPTCHHACDRVLSTITRPRAAQPLSHQHRLSSLAHRLRVLPTRLVGDACEAKDRSGLAIDYVLLQTQVELGQFAIALVQAPRR